VIYRNNNKGKVVVRLNTEKHLHLTHKLLASYLLSYSCRLNYPISQLKIKYLYRENCLTEDIVPSKTNVVVQQKTKIIVQQQTNIIIQQNTKSHTLTRTNPIQYPSNLRRIQDRF
jgi:hypothetical protein